MTPTEIYIKAALMGICAAATFLAIMIYLIRKSAKQTPDGQLAHFIQENNKQFVYWKNAGNEDYAAAHQMLINAFTQVKPTEDGKQQP